MFRWVVVFDILFGAGVFGIGAKFPTYWDQWVFFPTVPNILDTIFLSIAGVYFMWRGAVAWRAAMRSNLRKDVEAMGALASTILMVVITLLLALVLYWMVTRL
jgi:hypothetical protein